MTPTEDQESSEKNMSEYAEQLRCWLGQAYSWQCMPFMISPNLISGCHTSYTSPVNSNAYSPSQTTQRPSANNSPANAPNNRQTPVAPLLAVGRIYEIPKLSKRLFAEAIDFGLLFFIKAIITITILDTWNLEDFGLLETENNEGDDYELAMNLTANLLTIEIIHRILVVFYEVYFTHQGGTPGKRTMGLKVLSCTRCLSVGENTVLVEPATDITLGRSLSRACLKNMGTAVLFPTFLPFMVVQHNRTLYDILCGTVVVESP